MRSLIATLMVIGLILLSLSCAKKNINPYRDIIPFGPDTYSISLSSVWGYSKARSVVYRKAINFCQSRNQIFMPKNERAISNQIVGSESCTLIFRCLNEGDAELRRPEYILEPDIDIDIKIEDRRK